MFSDLVSHIPQIKGVVERVKGRKLRVATMCSGTESPLLALDLICRSLSEQHDISLDIEHVFSCEIEPFKQAYIERNFQPPLLFRDVCELGEDEAYATTAYGALAPVPGDVDLLVAGTSCVDYSNLNNEKQDIDGNGESGRTFRGMMSWVTTHRPPLVILENVCSAPWDRVVEYFNKNGYSATHTRVDTKQYYIPHTRTRVYLLAVNERRSDMPKAWKEWVTSKLKRQASSTLDAFLLPSDDPRIHQARQKLVQESYNGTDRRTGRTDWGRCESRHQRARLEEALGPKRPLTNWDEGGTCKMPDFAWGDWGVGQVERVWDLMDITLLRSAKNGVDPSYKTLIWNLSQNVDRTIGSSRLGICPCLTPSMIPYITNRGGPLVGLEALSMQGLPIDKLLLTRETEDQLADLAGNAMSTTVVGACILAALVVGKKLLKAGNDEQTYEMKEENHSHSGNLDANAMDVDSSLQKAVSINNIQGDGQLVRKSLDLSATKDSSLPRLLSDAQKSVRLCECEGRKDITTRELMRCKDCGSSSCRKCGGRPEHNYEIIDVATNVRLAPSIFSKELKSTLPMALSLANITEDLLDELKTSSNISIPETRWVSWRSAVIRAKETELRFVEPKRQEIWSAIYQSPTALMELSLHPQQTEWRLYAKPEDSEPANAEIRQLLQMPVARFSCDGDLLHGRWQFALPCATTVSITLEGVGELVPSWEARLGLLGEEYKDRAVYPRIRVTVPDDNISKLDRNISGEFVLLDKCGTANSALHKKDMTPEEQTLPPIFMFLDPTRCGDPNEDAFIFSTSKRRYEYGESRPVICTLDPKWRQSDVEGKQNVKCHIPLMWVDALAVKLEVGVPSFFLFNNISDLHPSTPDNASFSVPGDKIDVPVHNDACQSANALLACNVPLGSDAGPEWPRGEWREVDKVHERGTFKALAWLMERIRHVDGHFSDWQAVEMPQQLGHCERCAPNTPTIKWKKTGKKVSAIEDSIEAGQYERNLKLRPSPFVTQLKLEDKVGIVKIGINIPSLLHRALSRLPSTHRPEKPVLSWRLDTDFMPSAKIDLPVLSLMSNKDDPEHAQPPNFKLPLRPEQLRSLTWMLQQEAADTVPFVEEEISEAISEPLGWRAEGRAQRPVRVRGGVLADQVGYGKTAITLGLIDCASKDVKEELEEMGDMAGKVPTKATLAVVPPHLTRQWASEAKKFAGKRFKNIVVISTATQMNSLTVEQVQEADIVIVASNLFQSSVYLANLESFAAGGSLPGQDGRYFNARLERTLASLRRQVDLLKEEGSTQVIKAIREARRRGKFSDELEAEIFVAPKRLKGKSYREAVPESKKENSKLDIKEHFPAKPNRSGLTPEVLLPAPKKRKDTDPWGLESAAVKKDWTQMRAPPLETFYFSRVVVDEYTYLEGKVHSLVTKLTAERRWVLSGTPPIHDFGAVKTIAAHLNLHLGIDDDGEGQSVMIKKRRREQTAVEKFHSFREVHSTEWHAHRHQLGQNFLDHFVRQNIAEIDEIPSTFKIVKISLPAAERAIYLELEHHLRALDMTIKRGKKTESDREKRLAQSLGESSTAEEALLKRCSHFDLDTSDKENAMKACEVIVKERTKQLEDCKTELRKKLREALVMQKKIGKTGEESMFQEYVRISRTEGVGDKDASKIVTELLDEVGVPASSAAPPIKNKGKGKDDVQLPAKIKDLVWEHREHTHDIRKLTKELVGRKRSLRYFTVVRDLQKQRETPPLVSCPVCQREQIPMDEVAVLSSCGHTGCMTCVKLCADKEECVHAASGVCKAAARVLNIVKGDTLGVDDLARDGQGKHYGMKLEKVIDLVKKQIPSEERVLIFVQFPDLMKKVAEALTANKIKFLEIKGTATQKSKNLEKFQNDSEERVLLLNVMDESASGANLTSANHAIFLSPLLAASQEIYEACETQAIGRLRRYGQTNHVYIWRFLTLDTIDVEIYEQRAKEKI
ncbi:hypothetical protein SERLA73DRAFT_93465 [Serpula lacrymans var. lacrymans S7.3]|uniref:Helicase C-terminal domain-containing protein n=1 Tax=Serpula lacrymans var. lacrymans (strain S7.3) TaxID=936435 RepID=F8Q3Y0_SERL3|nr:hypothetical protein SERLA73DRAFT_93465 [Serpula lacrymans var. lacrymans S7.3]